EAGQAGHQDDVVDQQRPVAEPEAVVDARLVADAPLEENELERARLLEADVVHVELAEELGGELAGKPSVVEEEARVHEVGLPLVLAAAQAREQAERSEEHTSELQSRGHLVCRLLLEKKK